MPATTTNHALPYPLGTDPPNVAPDIQSLAQKLDTEVPLPNVPNGYVRLDGSSNIALSAAQKIIWAGDTNLYRSAAGVLQTDQGLYVGNGLTAIWGITTSGNYTQRAAIGDSQPVIAFNRDFKGAGQHGIIMGPGGAAGVDVNLYRRQAGQWQTDSSLYLQGTTNFLGTWQPADTSLRWSVNVNGVLQWGPGNAASDTQLYRMGVNYLGTPGAMYAGQGFNANAMNAATTAAVQIAVTGDTQDRFYIRADGFQAWGPGNAAADTTLSRIAAGAIGFTGGIYVQAAPLGVGYSYNPGTFAAGNIAFQSAVTGETPRYVVNQGGDIHWGPGGATTQDTNLYRVSAGMLKTDGGFIAQSTLGSYQNTTNVLTGVGFDVGAASSPWTYTSLWYDTTNNFAKVGSLSGGVAWRNVFVGWAASALVNTIYFSTNNVVNYDTNLYRLNAGTLKTDGNFDVGGAYYISDVIAWSRPAAGYMRSGDVVTQIMRSAAGQAVGIGLPTDTTEHMRIDTNGRIDWGPGNAATDTNLYRTSAGVLRTDSILQVGNYVNATGGYASVGQSAASNWVFWTSVSGDTYQRLVIYASGRHEWSSGAAASDTFLQRVFARGLQTNAWIIWSVGTDPTNPCISTQIDADAYTRFSMDANGNMHWGSGTAAQDVNLYRGGAGWLYSSNIYIQGQLWTSNGILSWGSPVYAMYNTADSVGLGHFTMGGIGAGGPAVFFGQNNDCAIMRYAANFLATNGWFWSGWGTSSGNGGFAAVQGGDGWPRVGIANNGYITFGPGNAGVDCSLYRIGAGRIATDSLIEAWGPSGGVGFYIYRTGDTYGYPRWQTDSAGMMKWGPGGGVSLDCNLYRYAAGTLQTDSNLNVEGILNADGKFQLGSFYGYVTSFPSSPVDGQICILVDSKTNPSYQWMFRYNGQSASTYKWEFIGGAPWMAHGSDGVWTAMAVSANNYILPRINAPRSGDYTCVAGSQVQSGSGVTIQLAVSAQNLSFSSPTATSVPPAGIANLSTGGRLNGVSGGTSMGPMIQTDSNGGNYGNSFFSIVPVRLI